MEDEKLFEFMTKMYSEMQEGFKQVNNKGRQSEINKPAAFLNDIVVSIITEPS